MNQVASSVSCLVCTPGVVLCDEGARLLNAVGEASRGEMRGECTREDIDRALDAFNKHIRGLAQEVVVCTKSPSLEGRIGRSW